MIVTTHHGPITTFYKQSFVTNYDVATGKVVNIFLTHNADPTGRLAGTLYYEPLEILSACAVIQQSSDWNYREGVLVSINVRGTVKAWDTPIAVAIQHRHNFARFVGVCLAPYGIYMEIRGGGGAFKAGDAFQFSVNYRTVEQIESIL